jgi:hypothetical protein
LVQRATADVETGCINICSDLLGTGGHICTAREKFEQRFPLRRVSWNYYGKMREFSWTGVEMLTCQGGTEAIAFYINKIGSIAMFV